MLRFIKNYIFNTLFPSSCLGCQKVDSLICDDCLNKISIDRNPIPLKNSQLSAIATADTNKNPLLHQLIYIYKYQFVKELAKPLGKILTKITQNTIDYYSFGNLENVILIPVPLHKRRLQWRGFNQAELLANEISIPLKIPVYDMILKRIKHTKPQMEIENKNERIKNISDAFELYPNLNPQLVTRNSIIILIDDISTSGSTLEECAKTLKPLEPKIIIGITLAKG